MRMAVPVFDPSGDQVFFRVAERKRNGNEIWMLLCDGKKINKGGWIGPVAVSPTGVPWIRVLNPKTRTWCACSVFWHAQRVREPSGPRESLDQCAAPPEKACAQSLVTLYEDAGMVKGRYQQVDVNGHKVRERCYEILSAGERACQYKLQFNAERASAHVSPLGDSINV